jgi:D-glycero-alpha-D-manno-heptose-7-phosphate kinase
MIIVQTPLRISFFGGGTDFPSFFAEESGCALSTTINKYVFVIIKSRFDEKLRIAYTQTEIVDHVDQIQHELIREALLKTGISNGVEIITLGDIPAGSGLGSSSSVTVGALNAMYRYIKQDVSIERLAKEACEIEIDILRKPIGIQDQYISAFGGFRFMEFERGGKVTCQNITLNHGIQRRLNENLLLFFTGMTRQANDILNEQNHNIQHNLVLLRQMKALAYTALKELTAGNIDVLGPLLDESWQMKKRLASHISNDAIEGCYRTALKAGALGGKITGAGGGGFLLLYCPYEKRESVRAGLSHLRELPFEIEPDGSKVIFDYRT